MKNVLLISCDKECLEQVQHALGAGFEVLVFPSVESAWNGHGDSPMVAAFVDLCDESLRQDWSLQLNALKETYTDAMVFAVVTDEARGMSAIEAGALDYVMVPLRGADLGRMTRHLQRQKSLAPVTGFWRREFAEFVTTQSDTVRDVLHKIKAVAPTKSTVLLGGETGVGKGVVAMLIHQHSPRRDGPFVSVHCGAIPENLVESELFGHERGAFTGAIRRKLGRFELAHKGTIFLDEIGTISPPLQVKLLKVIQEAIFHRVGGESDIYSDVRIVAASNVDLKQFVAQGAFRKDLYYRLNVFPIDVPPLRDRREDIPYFSKVFLRRMNRLGLKEITDIPVDLMKALVRYDWPGNIRELENLIERAHILATGNTLSADSFPPELFEDSSKSVSGPVDIDAPLEQGRRRVVEQFEAQYLISVLTAEKGHITRAASRAGIGTRQLNKLMRKYAIDKRPFKG